MKRAIPQDVIDSVLAIGKVENGTTVEQSDEQHNVDHAKTLKLTREYFGTVGDVAMKSVYLKDTDVVLAHTGTSPNAEQHAIILAGLWNWLHDVASTPDAANDNNAFADQINDMVAHFHGKSKAAGWWKEGERDLTGDKYVHATKLMLCVSELAEAMEGLRKNLMDDKLPHRKMAEVELADALIRIFDLAGVLGYDLGGAMVEKSAYNTVRPDHQPGNRMIAGGKAY